MIETAPMLYMTGGIAAICVLIFVINIALNRNDRSGLIWSAAVLSALTSATSNALWASVPDSTETVVAGNAMLVLSVALIWSGCRAYGGDRPFVWAGVVMAVVTALVTMASAGAEGEWAGSPITWFLTVVFSLLGVQATASKGMRSFINARILMGVLVIHGLYYAARLVVFIAVGPDAPTFRDYLGTGPTSVITILLIVGGTIAMTALHAERGVLLLPRGPRSVMEDFGALAPTAFAEGGTDRLDRVSTHHLASALIAMRVDDLAEIATSYDADALRQLDVEICRILRATLHPSTVIGYAGTGAFNALAIVEGPGQAADIVDELQDALAVAPIIDDGRLRVSMSFGVAMSMSGREGWDPLVDLAESRLRSAQAAGGNTVVDAG